MLGSAIGCGILLGVFEGVGVLVGRLFAETNKPVSPLVSSSLAVPVQDLYLTFRASTDPRSELSVKPFLELAAIEEAALSPFGADLPRPPSQQQTPPPAAPTLMSA